MTKSSPAAPPAAGAQYEPQIASIWELYNYQMAKKRRHSASINLDQKVRECQMWTTSLTWRAPADARLDQLVAAAKDEGETTSRSELLAALVAAAPTSGLELGNLLRGYRRMTVRDLLPPQPALADLIQLPR